MSIVKNNPQQFQSNANQATYTLPDYAVTNGSDRLLVVFAHLQRGVEADFTAAATFNGVSLTQAVTASGSSSSRWYRVCIWYLIAPAVVTANVVVTSSAALQGALIGAVTLTGAAQSSVLGQTATGSGDPATMNLVSCLSGSLVVAAVVSNSNGAPTWTWTTAIEDYDLNYGNDSAEVAGSAASYLVPSGGNVTVSADRTGTAPAQLGAAAEFKRVPASGVKPVVLYHNLIRSNA